MTEARRRWVVIAIVAALAVVMTGYVLWSGDDDGSGGSSGAGGSSVPLEPSKEWKALRDAPCDLLSAADVAKALGWSGAEAEDDDTRESTCRYRAEDDNSRVATVEVLRTQTEASLAGRTLGTISEDTGYRLRLDTPGVGTIVTNDGAAAVVAVRDAEVTGEDLTAAIVGLGELATDSLPSTPMTRVPFDERDPCGIVTARSLGRNGITGGDAQDPAFCAYRLPDGTLIRFGTSPPPPGGTKTFGEPLRGSAPRARVVATTSGSGGSVRVLAPVGGDRVVDVTVSSPERPVAELQDLAAGVAERLAAAA